MNLVIIWTKNGYFQEWIKDLPVLTECSDEATKLDFDMACEVDEKLIDLGWETKLVIVAQERYQ